MICDALHIVDEEVLEYARAALLRSFKDLVLHDPVVGIEAYVRVLDIRIELTLRAEEYMFFSRSAIPEGKAVLVHAPAPALYLARSGELVAVAEVIPVVAGLVEETAAAMILCIRTIV